MISIIQQFKLFSETQCAFCIILGKPYSDIHEDESSVDVSSPRDNNSPIVSQVN